MRYGALLRLIMIDPLKSIGALRSEEEDEERVGFGSHNLYASDFSLFSALPCFPWQEFFSANGFRDPFPAVIYGSDEGELLYQKVMAYFDTLAQIPSLRCSFGLSYREECTGSIGFLEIELMAKIEPSSWKNAGQDAHIILPYIFQSVALWVANEVRAPEDPMPLVSAESFAPLVENDTEGYRATFLLRLSTTLPE